MQLRKYLSWMSMNKEKGFKIELIWGKMLLNEYGWGKHEHEHKHRNQISSKYYVRQISCTIRFISKIVQMTCTTYILIQFENQIVHFNIIS